MVPMKFWAPADLDEIITYGDINYRKHINRGRRHAVLKPPQIKFKVYLSRAITYTQIGAKRLKGFFDPNNTNELLDHINQMLEEFESIIFTYCEQSFAIWKAQKAFYILNSEDTDDLGRLVERTRGACCVIRSPGSVNQIVEYLASDLRVAKKCYEIYSFKVNERFLFDEKPEPFVEPEPVRVPAPVERPKTAEVKNEKPRLDEIIFKNQPEPEFGNDYRNSHVPSHGFLTCELFLTKSADDVKRAPFVCASAIAMLRICKASIWKPSTVKEVFRIGHEIFKTQVENVLLEWDENQKQLKQAIEAVAEAKKVMLEQVEEVPPPTQDKKPRKTVAVVPITEPKEDSAPVRIKKVKKEKPEVDENRPEIPFIETQPVVSLKKQDYDIRVENVIFGKVQKRGQDVISIEDGVKLFFTNFDCGVIQGPDVVAIWRESNFYFMFDPNPCTNFSRSFEEDSNCCLSWFKNLDDLTKLYIENISKELRNSVFKIAKVDVLEHERRSEDWQKFKAIGWNKWVLRGNMSESSTNYQDSNRSHQSTCISVASLAKTRELGVQCWTPEVIDEIIEIGDEFYSGSVMMLKNQERFVDPNLTLTEIGNELMIDQKIVDLAYEDCVVAGSLTEGMKLLEGLEKFFADDDLGILISCGVSMALFKHLNAFYLFDAHDRDAHGRNLKVKGDLMAPMIVFQILI